MQAHILSLHTPLTHGVGSKVKTFFLSERSHIAYQIKGNGAYSTMQAHILSLHTPSTCGLYLKLSKILNVVMSHIKLRGKKYGLT